MIFVNNVLELTASAGTGDLILLGPEVGFRSFGSQAADGQVVAIQTKDGTADEVATAVFRQSPDRLTNRTYISSSTGSLISWPGTGQRQVLSVLPAQFINSLHDSENQQAGMIARVAAFTYAARALQDGTFVKWLFRDGVANAPKLDDSLLSSDFLRRNVAASLISTLTKSGSFAEIIDYFAGSPSRAYVKGPSGEDMFAWERTAAQIYKILLKMGTGAGDWRRLLTANASDLNDADRLQGLASTQISMASSAGYYYESAPLPIISGSNPGGDGGGPFNHGLPVKPAIVGVRLTCTNANHEYLDNDTIELGPSCSNIDGSGNGGGHMISTTATQIAIRFHNSNPVYRVPDKTSGITVGLAIGSWTATIRAWA